MSPADDSLIMLCESCIEIAEGQNETNLQPVQVVAWECLEWLLGEDETWENWRARSKVG